MNAKPVCDSCSNIMVGGTVIRVKPTESNASQSSGTDRNSRIMASVIVDGSSAEGAKEGFEHWVRESSKVMAGFPTPCSTGDKGIILFRHRVHPGGSTASALLFIP